MEGPVEITFKEVHKTDHLESLITEKISKLEKICSHMISCRVTVEHPQQHQETGNPYQVTIDMRVPPNHELVAKQRSSKGDMHDPLETVIVKVFHKAERQLKDLVQKQHGDVKLHPQQQVMGIVHEIFPDKDYGFIKTVDTQDDVYFHRNSLHNRKFGEIKIGDGVRCAVEQGDKGLQATSVEVVYKPGAGQVYKAE